MTDGTPYKPDAKDLWTMLGLGAFVALGVIALICPGVFE